MTNIDRSPDDLTLWRAAAFAEPPIRLTGRHPAALRDGQTVTIEANSIGADLTTALVDYLDGSRGRYPVHDALLRFERYCRRAHARWPDHRGRPVCAEIVWAVVRGRTSLLWAADQAGVSWPRAERLLLGAVEFMRRQQERWIAADRPSASHDREACAVCRAESGAA